MTTIWPDEELDAALVDDEAAELEPNELAPDPLLEALPDDALEPAPEDDDELDAETC